MRCTAINKICYSALLGKDPDWGRGCCSFFPIASLKNNEPGFAKSYADCAKPGHYFIQKEASP